MSNSNVVNIEVKESMYNCNKEKGLDTPFLYITLIIKGVYGGQIYFETCAGSRNTGEPIYYICSHERAYKSELEDKIMNYYKNTYPRLIEELFLDIALDKNKYLNLDTNFHKYELWDSNPNDYSNTMEGYYFNEDKFMSSYYKYESLGRIYNYKKVEDFGENDDCANWTTESVEWRRYYL